MEPARRGGSRTAPTLPFAEHSCAPRTDEGETACRADQSAEASAKADAEGESETVDARIDARDRAARAEAVDPRVNVALEASAGTGKTRVLVDRYVNLLRAGVEPANILAITFTRKAAAEMRGRIVASLREAAARGELPPSRWRELRDRIADISIGTIDAFCLSLLREFPLEADLDPGFSLADETEVPRLIDEALDRALRMCRSIAREDANVALVFAHIGERRVRAGLAALLNRRLVAPRVLATYLSRAANDLTIDQASRRAAAALLDVFQSMPGGLERFIDSGPAAPSFALLARALRQLESGLSAGAVRGSGPPSQHWLVGSRSDPTSAKADVEHRSAIDGAGVQVIFARIREYFLTQDGVPRSRLVHTKAAFPCEVDWQVHRDLVVRHADAVARGIDAHRRDLNVLVSHGVWRMFQIAAGEYRRTLDSHALLDFSDVLMRALELLRQMEEFARSRYRLESRYHHLLVDEFQDTSRAQWDLISLLVQSWGEGAGLAHAGPLQPSIFIVGDRKQSIYGFRDADVSILREAARHLEGLRPSGRVRRSISRSFRAVPGLLSFVNDLCHDIGKSPARPDAFEYGEDDRFPLDDGVKTTHTHSAPLGLIAADSVAQCAELAAAEIAALIATGAAVRDRESGVSRAVRAGDIAVLFRSRESHREFEEALERRGVAAYVYKGLGFFDADEIKDVLALLWYLADPLSDLRAAAFLRSRVVRLTDEALRLLAPGFARALRQADPPPAQSLLDEADARALEDARAATRRWRGLVDRLTPAELLDLMLTESAYAVELRGPRFNQAWENLKKMRALVRKIQNRGYTTLSQLAANLDRLAVGDDSNAVIDAVDAVSLMTVHASKGLEFPVVFVVNLARGTGNRRDPIRVWSDPAGDSVSVAVGDFELEADDDQSAREREETKRLLYVALTRARDRLYLASVVKDGVLQPGRGSLAEVLPPSLINLFAAASTGADAAEWRASSGAVHRFRVLGRLKSAPTGESDGSTSDGMDGSEIQRPPVGTQPDSDFLPLSDASPARQTISEAILVSDTPHSVNHGDGDSDRLTGTLVHRLLHRLGFQREYSDGELRALASQLLRPGESDGITAGHSVLDDVVSAYRAISARSDVRALYAAGDRLHEVPFTMRMNGGLLRGTIDCLVRTHTRVTIVEFKTGAAQPHHHAQLELYRRAAERLFPDATIETLLIYSGDTP